MGRIEAFRLISTGIINIFTFLVFNLVKYKNKVLFTFVVVIVMSKLYEKQFFLIYIHLNVSIGNIGSVAVGIEIDKEIRCVILV